MNSQFVVPAGYVDISFRSSTAMGGPIECFNCGGSTSFLQKLICRECLMLQDATLPAIAQKVERARARARQNCFTHNVAALSNFIVLSFLQLHFFQHCGLIQARGRCCQSGAVKSDDHVERQATQIAWCNRQCTSDHMARHCPDGSKDTGKGKASD